MSASPDPSKVVPFVVAIAIAAGGAAGYLVYSLGTAGSEKPRSVASKTQVAESRPAAAAEAGADDSSGPVEKKIVTRWEAPSDDDIVGEVVVETESMPHEDGIPIFGDIAEFAMTESRGAAVSKETLAGKVWVADFVFTRCSGPCPVMTQGLKRLQDLLPEGDDVKMVTFTVDPDYDTPKVLIDFATRYDADPDRWLFVRGDYDDTQRFAQESLMVGIGREGAWVDEEGNILEEVNSLADAPHVGEDAHEADESEEIEDAAPDAEATEAGDAPKIVKKKFVATSILHSEKYIVIDHKGRIRGYYDGTKFDSTDKVLFDVERLRIAAARESDN